MSKLLIADGSPMMHRIMELTFAQEGMQVVSVSDGKAISSLPAFALAVLQVSTGSATLS